MLSVAAQHRRALHRIPELGFALPQTVAYVEEVLRALPCRVFFPTPGAVCGYFDAGKPETVAFRADMDALPVTEDTRLPFASTHLGCMHACGHDGHTAMVLALAQRLAQRREPLPCNVLVLFQPAEETTGGAQPLCESGVLEEYGVSRVFGLHLWPGLPQGSVFTRPGPMMARSSEIAVGIDGAGVHISQYQRGRDALWAATEFVRLAYDMAATVLGGQRVLRFGKLTSGTARNVVSDRSDILGSMRSFDDETFAALKGQLEALALRVTEDTGCGVAVEVSRGYPPVCNDEALYHRVCAAMGSRAPQLLENPVLAAEDFSFYQRRVPGLFFFLGVGNTAALHAPDFDFDDEAVLPCGVNFLEGLLTC